MLLSPEILTILTLNGLFFIFASMAFFLSIRIFLYWDMDSSTKLQYSLERESFLVSTIIKYIFILKSALFPLFIFTLDRISNLITGAMCGAGVVTASPYGIYLLILKVTNMYLFGLWLSIHYMDVRRENLPYTKIKFELFIIAYILLSIEILLIWLFFSGIDVDKMVSCCGTLFSSSASSSMGSIIRIDSSIILTLFYLTFAIMVALYKFKVKYLFAISNIIFIFISLISLISFFGTYIYELPTHHCPFCFLQGDYHYIGYILYTLLFIGTFYGLRSGVMEILGDGSKGSYKKSILFNGAYTILVSLYPLSYFLKNGVFL